MTVLLTAVIGSLQGGSAVRLALIADALASLGPVDLFVVTNPGQRWPVPGGDCARRVEVVYRDMPNSLTQAARWCTRREPAHLARLDLTTAASGLAAFVRLPYDATWLYKADSWVLACKAGLDCSGAVCDVDDLDDVRLESLARLRHASVAPPPELTGLEGAVRAIAGRVDRGRWKRLRLQIAEDVGLVTVSSAAEAARSGLAGCAVVPNGFPAVEGHEQRGRSGLVLVGSFRYLPNLDAARWFIDAVFPLVRRTLPTVTLRIVGDHDSRVAQVPGVTWTGAVSSTTDELAAAAVAVVPMRAGAGTPVKLLEAWAAGVPVVSTASAVAGLEVSPDVDVVVADTSAAFADACVSLLRDRARCDELATAGRERWQRHHSPGVVRDAVVAAVEQAKRSDPSELGPHQR